jgi:hypothetical protein
MSLRLRHGVRALAAQLAQLGGKVRAARHPKDLLSIPFFAPLAQISHRPHILARLTLASVCRP